MPRLLLGPLLRHVGVTDATMWVETDGPCEVEVLGRRERTWTVSGHHYAVLILDDLPTGTGTRYDVRLDGDVVWPEPQDPRPVPRIRTYKPGASVQIAFGSCRYARAAEVEGDRRFDADALDCYANRVATLPEEQWPEALVLLGDQVYADETSQRTQRRIAERRDIHAGAGSEVADFEEYTWLYTESWTDPEVRWLLSTVPSSMIFDDHDVHDDWNTSKAWRDEVEATDWWSERIIGALASYWVYQHLGNLSPDELARDELLQRVRAHRGDAWDLLRAFAIEADQEADGAKGARWSYRRDLGPIRLIVIDTRCGRVLDGRRGMVGDEEFAWIEEQARGDYDHLLVGSSLPWLLPRAMHDLEAWNEQLCGGARGPRFARWSEKLRRAADLEHWAAFNDSFDRLARLVSDVAGGRYADGGTAPATVCVLSGDVHHAYIARARFDDPDGRSASAGTASTSGDKRGSAASSTETAVFQLTCSPLHNYVPRAMKVAFRAGWSRAADRGVRAVLGVVARLPPLRVQWTKEFGPSFGNELMTLEFTDRRASVLLEQAGPQRDPTLREVTRMQLA